MLSHGTYNLSDSEFKTPRISLNLKSAKILPRENKALYSIHVGEFPSIVGNVTINSREFPSIMGNVTINSREFPSIVGNVTGNHKMRRRRTAMSRGVYIQLSLRE